MSKSTKSYQLWMCKYCGIYDVTESSGSFPQHSENCDCHLNRGGYIGPHHWVRQGKVDYSRYQEVVAERERYTEVKRREAEVRRRRKERSEEIQNMQDMNLFELIAYIKNKLF